MAGTNLNASSALDAADGPMEHFKIGFPTFRIVTPGTPQRTAFEKDGRANAGPVVNRVFFYIKNCTGYVSVIHLLVFSKTSS